MDGQVSERILYWRRKADEGLSGRSARAVICRSQQTFSFSDSYGADSMEKITTHYSLVASNEGLGLCPPTPFYDNDFHGRQPTAAAFSTRFSLLFSARHAHDRPTPTEYWLRASPATSLWVVGPLLVTDVAWEAFWWCLQGSALVRLIVGLCVYNLAGFNMTLL